LDTTWALSELNNFRTLTELEPPPDRPNVVNLSPCLFIRGNLADIVASAHVVEQIFDRIIPNWRSEVRDQPHANTLKLPSEYARFCSGRKKFRRSWATTLRA
jgi:hypothetical protein